MNNKGFAVSIIIYSIVFLIIAILYMLLGIEKQRYAVNGDLRESVTNYLNENLEFERSCEWTSTSQSGLSSCASTSSYNKNNMINHPNEGDVYYTCSSSYYYIEPLPGYVYFVETRSTGEGFSREREILYASKTFYDDVDPVTNYVTKTATTKLHEWVASTKPLCEAAYSSRQGFCEGKASPTTIYQKTTYTYICT